MTLEKQRAALKELFGNKHTDKDGHINALFSDLNAVQWAALRKENDQLAFEDELYKIKMRERLLWCELKAMHWTEALLRALGKWQD